MHKKLGFAALWVGFSTHTPSKSLLMNTDTKSVDPSFSQTWFRRAGQVFGGLLLLWGVGWLALPPLIQSQLETRLGEQLGRRVTLGQVDFRPWSLELVLNDIAVGRATSSAPAAQNAAGQVPERDAQLFIKRIYIDMELQSLLRLAPVVDALHVDSPRLSLTHTGAGHYDVDDVLAKLMASPQTPEPTPASPLRFALYNLVLSEGTLAFADQPVAKVHRLSQLQLSLPFLSNLDAQRDVQVQPKLAFDLNGSKFDSAAHATPFAQTRKTDAQLVVKDLDLAPYLGYLPAALPVRLTSAVLNAQLKLAFEQAAQPVVEFSGWVDASKVALTTPAGADLLSFERLGVEVKSAQPLLQRVQLGKVEWTQPHLTLHRNPAGLLNVLALGQSDTLPQGASKKRAIPASRERATGQNDAHAAATGTAPSWQLSAQEFALVGGDILWLDDTTTKRTQLSLNGLEWQAQSLAWPVTRLMPFQGSARMASATLAFKGTATDQVADVAITLADWPLSGAAPYVADLLIPKLDGMVNADVGVHWAAAGADQAAQMRLSLESLSLDKLSLANDKKPVLASIGRVLLEDATLDLTKQSAMLGRLQIKQPKVSVSRAADGQWMFQDWLKAPHRTPSAATVGAGKPGTATGQQPWSVRVNDLQLAEGMLNFADHAAARPVALDVAGLSLQLKNFGTSGNKPFAVNLAARVRHGNTEPGKLAWRGNSSLSPLSIRGDVTAEHLPLHALAPYASEFLNVTIQRADTSYKGRVQVAEQALGMALQLQGDLRLEELQVQSQAQTEPFLAAGELLNWKSLSVTGMDVAVNPGMATRVAVQGVVLSDFFAKVVLSEAGRLNLQDLVKSSAPVTPATQPAAAASAVPSPAASVPPTVAAAAASSSSVASSGSGSAALAPIIHIGPISLVGGHVNFTDRFIQPNYSADLTELVGKLSAVSTRSSMGEIQLADLELRGRAEGSATLQVLGKINPLVQPLALDIQGKVRDLELAPLSTYSARYAGYGIERGKLSVDVAYKVQAEGQLTANNNVVLNQLKFGDQVPGASNSLPVKLAVALLADRNGVIDIDLPISGSLNDPQFRLLPIVFKIIGNLIVKAITAPFSLLASAFGGAGGDELSMVNFEPGQAVLSEAAKAGLAKVARALQDRPALKMTVVGTASLEVEREAYKRSQLQALVLAEKRRASSPASASATEPPATASPQEYPDLLKTVYKRADFPKPRNLIGLTKDIPVPDMEALLLAHLDASEAAMQALAVKRAVVVRDHLASLKLPAERLFLGAAKAVVPDAKWQPRAELNLAAE